MARQHTQHHTPPKEAVTAVEAEQLTSKVEPQTQPEPQPEPIHVEAPPTQAPAPQPIVWPEYDKEAFAQCQNTSQRIRFLHGAGWKRSQIAKFLSEYRGKKVLYQHVRNVILAQLTGKQSQGQS